ncbi:MAG: hypothetical protein OEV94_09865 [Deltaproteobacteria bacterium]|nr:hypothetical protein [Deltaproteobacteria bacterium]MDH4121997.1 hypothetical protein [Deltaproteobacteria bacterium]
MGDSVKQNDRLRGGNPGQRLAQGVHTSSWILGAFMLVGLAGWAMPAQADSPEELFVPEGVHLAMVSVLSSQQNKGWSDQGKIQPLALVWVQDPAVRAVMTGGASRSLTVMDFRWRQGLTDRWNLEYRLPMKSIQQKSTLAPNGAAGAALAEINSFPNQTLSGFGDLEVHSHHRVYFGDDWTMTLGYGFSVPASPVKTTQPGFQTLRLTRLSPGVVMLAHSSWFPFLSASAIDLDFYMVYLGETALAKFDGTTGNAQPGREINLKLGYRQEVASVGFGLWVEQASRGSNTHSGTNLRDASTQTSLHGALRLGNLAGAEQGEEGARWRVELEVQSVQKGRLAPTDSGLRLNAQWWY